MDKADLEGWKYKGWLQRRAATGMHDLHLKERELPITQIKPYVAWLNMMKYIFTMEGWEIENTSFLDVGCGIGAYAPLVDTYFPGMQYEGCDFSPHMIEYAKQGYGEDRFFECDVANLEVGANVIFASSVLEPCPYWRLALRRLMSLEFEYLILHRVKMWNHSARVDRERTYMTMYGTPSFEVVHNRAGLWRLIKEAGGRVARVIEYQQQEDFNLHSILIKKHWADCVGRETWSDFIMPELEMKACQEKERKAPEYARPLEQRSPLRLGRLTLAQREAGVVARVRERFTSSGYVAITKPHLYEEVLQSLVKNMGQPAVVVISVLDWWFKPVMDAVYAALVQYSEWEIGLRVNEFAEMYLQRTSAVPKEDSAGDDDGV